MPSNKMLVVCERCGLVALLPETDGWEMHTTQKGLCPACIRESETADASRKPRSKTAH